MEKEIQLKEIKMFLMLKKNRKKNKRRNKKN